MIERSANDITFGKALAEIGSDLREIGRHYAANWGLIVRNPEYLPLARNTPLCINCQPYSVKKNVKEGERDLVRLAHVVPYEGIWIYTPKDSTWYHVSSGHKEKFGERGSFKFSSTQRFTKLTIPGNEIAHYHTHPKRAGEHMTTYAWTEFGKNTVEKDADIVKKVHTAFMYLYLAFPSNGDIELYQYWLQSCKEQGVSFQGRIASPIGITSVDFGNNIENVIEEYQRVYNKLFNINAERKYVRYEKHNGKPTIAIALEDMFEDVNVEMQGKLCLKFRQRNCGLEL